MRLCGPVWQPRVGHQALCQEKRMLSEHTPARCCCLRRARLEVAMRTGSMCESWASPGVHTRRSGEGGYQPSGGGLHDARSPCECRFSVAVTRCTAARAAAYTLCLRHADRAGGPAIAERDRGCSPLDGMDIDTPAPGTGLPAHARRPAPTGALQRRPPARRRRTRPPSASCPGRAAPRPLLPRNGPARSCCRPPA